MIATGRRSGVDLYYEQAGRGEPPLVFVPGWCCDHTFLRPQFDHFKSSHSVIALDLRGCGRSDRPDDGYDIPTLADDVATLCRRLAISRPVVVGHSLGGMIGIELAGREPSLPSAIIAVDPGPIDPLPEARSLFEELIVQLEGPDGDGARRAFIESMFLSTDDQERMRWVVDAMSSVPLSVAVAMLRGALAWNGAAALVLCSVPLFVLRSRPGGSNDPARLLAVKPDIQVGMTVGAGHFHQLEVPEQVIPMMERFLKFSTG